MGGFKAFVQFLNRNKVVRELILFPALTVRDKMKDLCNIQFILENNRSLKEFKDIHKGKRCFIVGNGPSLRMSDLDAIKDEYSFAANRIYQLYDKTEWRPTYYGLMDIYVYRAIKEDLKRENGSKVRFLVGNRKKLFDDEVIKDPKNRFYYLGTSWHPRVAIHFSNDFSKIVGNGRTITFTLMQLAIYMGFTEIYLLGIDHNWVSTIRKDGNSDSKLDEKNHVQGMTAIKFDAPAISNPDGNPLDKPTEAYQSAYNYACSHGIHMYNATRGGNLEVFPRVNMDEIIERINENKDARG